MHDLVKLFGSVIENLPHRSEDIDSTMDKLEDAVAVFELKPMHTASPNLQSCNSFLHLERQRLNESKNLLDSYHTTLMQKMNLAAGGTSFLERMTTEMEEMFGTLKTLKQTVSGFIEQLGPPLP